MLPENQMNKQDQLRGGGLAALLHNTQLKANFARTKLTWLDWAQGLLWKAVCLQSQATSEKEKTGKAGRVGSEGPRQGRQGGG